MTGKTSASDGRKLNAKLWTRIYVYIRNWLKLCFKLIERLIIRQTKGNLNNLYGKMLKIKHLANPPFSSISTAKWRREGGSCKFVTPWRLPRRLWTKDGSRNMVEHFIGLHIGLSTYVCTYLNKHKFKYCSNINMTDTT